MTTINSHSQILETITFCTVQNIINLWAISVNQLDNFTLVTDLNEQIGKG